MNTPPSPVHRCITVADDHLSSRSPSSWNSCWLLTAIAVVIVSCIQSGYFARTASACVAICAAMASTAPTKSSSQIPDAAASAVQSDRNSSLARFLELIGIASKSLVSCHTRVQRAS